MPRPRVRHHTSDANLDDIRASGAINPGRAWGSFPAAIHVEGEPFGTTRPFRRAGARCPKGELGIPEDGAFVEFDAPLGLRPAPGIGPRNTFIIPTAPDQPLPLEGLNPLFIKVRRYFWQVWRTKAE